MIDHAAFWRKIILDPEKSWVVFENGTCVISVPEMILVLRKYFLFYNSERQHQSLDYRTPQEVYEGRKIGGI